MRDLTDENLVPNASEYRSKLMGLTSFRHTTPWSRISASRLAMLAGSLPPDFTFQARIESEPEA
ncbi:hypothetical protein RBSWK_03074 [Rhodopirellula baltica SWK14]|uniref:Uncharacterized protein n=1 Tax=Rhodopirellula baltica SWK14 TaxID=993516 RepID=L7CFK1_RHOBT|nr:hypothetical protein RBSWK_03074 [Rhodopirellula baltica SWK14]